MEIETSVCYKNMNKKAGLMGRPWRGGEGGSCPDCLGSEGGGDEGFLGLEALSDRITFWA